METVRSLTDGAKSYVNEQVAAVKAFNKREALLQGVNLGEHIFIRHGLRHIAGCPHFDVWHAPWRFAPGRVRAGWTCPNAGLIVTSALMIWKTLILVTGSESPVRVALPRVHMMVLLQWPLGLP